MCNMQWQKSSTTSCVCLHPPIHSNRQRCSLTVLWSTLSVCTVYAADKCLLFSSVVLDLPSLVSQEQGQTLTIAAAASSAFSIGSMLLYVRAEAA